MAEGLGPVASAVVLPDSESARSLPSKRRLSSLSDPSIKRRRLSEESSTPPTVQQGAQNVEVSTSPQDVANTAPPDRRKSSVQEERKRGQRLFGGLLSTLSQSTPDGHHKRRQEIERRQQDKAKQQKAADEGRRADELANLRAVRKSEQTKYDEQVMRTRHTNLIAVAGFLRTKTEPNLYYKPWELLPRDDQRIRQQISDAKAIIAREVEEFNRLYQKDLLPEAIEAIEANETAEETVGGPHVEPLSLSHDAVKPPVQAPETDHVIIEQQVLEEHNGEVVLENEEDTVIY